jgi:hypothetical protein
MRPRPPLCALHAPNRRRHGAAAPTTHRTGLAAGQARHAAPSRTRGGLAGIDAARRCPGPWACAGVARDASQALQHPLPPAQQPAPRRRPRMPQCHTGAHLLWARPRTPPASAPAPAPAPGPRPAHWRPGRTRRGGGRRRR